MFRSNTEEEKEEVIGKLQEIGIASNDFVHKNKHKTPRVGTSSVGWIDSKNEIDLIKAKAGNRQAESNADAKDVNAFLKQKKNVTGKVGENLYIKPKNP